MSDFPAIEFKNLSFAYDSQKVLENVEFRIVEKDFVCIVGPNGGGKTTILKLMLGLLQPIDGEIRIFGKSPAQARRSIGYMPQHSQVDLRFPVNVFDVVSMGRVTFSRWFGPYRKQDHQAVMDALEAVKLADFATRPFAKLSGGQRQRALIARAIVAEPKILLLDEPTSNLDMKVSQEFYELLGELNKAITIVMVSHDVSFVSGYVKTVLCVHNNVAIHPTEELSDKIVCDLYGGYIRRVQHNHNCIELGCEGEHHHD